MVLLNTAVRRRTAPRTAGVLDSDAGVRRLENFLLILGLVTLPFQVVQFGPAQPGHVFLLAAFGLMVWRGAVVVTITEILVFLFFFLMVVILTKLMDAGRVKATDQLIKFGFVYPAFYLVGRWLGKVFSNRPPPLGIIFLAGLIVFEILVQRAQFPVIYKENNFGEGALHGTFRERNWLAVYVLLFSYFLFEIGARMGVSEFRRTVTLVVINGVTMALTGSKTAFVAVGLILLIKSKQSIALKLALIAAGAFIYMNVFADQFTEEAMRVRLEEERGLAFTEALRLIGQSPIGYGVGFVEHHFSTTALSVMGLGQGVNSIFSVPLDLMIIAGPAGLLFWLVFFAGVGTGSITILAPIAALSLLNPLHQSEMVYFFAGMLVSCQAENRAWLKAKQEAYAPRPAIKRRFGPRRREQPGHTASEAPS